MPGRPELPAFPDDVPTVPLAAISLKNLIANDEHETRKLLDAARTLGFFYLDLASHYDGRVLLEDAEGVFDVARDLACLPPEERERYRSTDNVWGYKAQHVDDPAANKTYAFNTSLDDLINHRPLRSLPPLMSDSAHLPSLSRTASAAQKINRLIVLRLEQSLQLPPGSFTKLHSDGERGRETSSHLSITITPPSAPGDPRRAFNAHTDYGTVTMVLHQVLGGLQVLVPNSLDGSDDGGAQWKYVKPIRGYAVVNLGDVLSLLTNSFFRSNIHRVLDPPGAQMAYTRFSLVYFLYPMDNYTVPLGAMADAKGHSQAEKGVQDMRFKDFISGRLGIGEATRMHVKGYTPGVFGERERALVALASAE